MSGVGGVEDDGDAGKPEGPVFRTNIPPRRYLQTTDEFLAHWPLVNTALGSALILTGNYAVANLTTDRASLATLINTEVTAENASQAASADRDTKRAAIIERVRQFNSAIRGFFPGTTYSAQLPKVPKSTDPMGVYGKSLQDMADIWAQINAISPVPVGAPIPLILAGGYTRATFLTDQTAILTAFSAVESAQLTAEASRLNRDQLFYAMYQRFKQYRQAVQGRLAKGAPLLDSLPSITPATGHTPDPVNISAMWDTNIGMAAITFTASTDPDLAQYELRACFGSRYKTDEEQVLDSMLAGSPVLRFESTDGLVASGSRVFYKVYVMLGTGNEKGSRSVSVTRP
jgi:hypothetical protein